MENSQLEEQRESSDKLHEECGVFGMYDFDGNDVASTIYYGLFALQGFVIYKGKMCAGMQIQEFGILHVRIRNMGKFFCQHPFQPKIDL